MTEDRENETAVPPRRDRRGTLGLSSADIDRTLLTAVFVALALVIGAVGYLVYAALAKPPAPRTEVERRVYYYEQGVKANPKQGYLWVSYATALVDAADYAKASQVIAEGLRSTDATAGLLVQRARLEHARGQDDKALKTADEAVAAVERMRADYTKEAAKKGLGAPFAKSEEIINAQILKGDIYAARGESQRAVEAYTAALKEDPLMADVLAARGDMYARLGDRTAARKDYREALRFDPKNTAATAGLEKLGDAD